MVKPVRIAMWSGPRNISTAMMRSFENRGDCAVIDEPFYAVYLAQTGLGHPMRDEILAAQPQGPREVITGLLGPVPQGAGVYYQKHMTQHMLPDLPLGWLDNVTNGFLIRAPEEIIASYMQKRDAVTQDDLGLKRQFEIFQEVKKRTGRIPPVLDAADLLKDPAGKLARLCEHLGIAWSQSMLSWPAGRRGSDGVWAAHWYESVEGSTEFAPYKEQEVSLPSSLEGLAQECRIYYDALRSHRI